MVKTYEEGTKSLSALSNFLKKEFGDTSEEKKGNYSVVVQTPGKQNPIITIKGNNLKEKLRNSELFNSNKFENINGIVEVKDINNGIQLEYSI